MASYILWMKPEFPCILVYTAHEPEFGTMWVYKYGFLGPYLWGHRVGGVGNTCLLQYGV